MTERKAAEQGVRRKRFPLRRRGERGQSLLELSLILPVMLVIVIGLVEVADSFNSYITILDASRDGARLGSKNLATDDQIKNLIAVETARLRDPLNTASDVTIQHTTFDGNNVIRVEVCYDRQLMLQVPLILPDTFRMCGETTMRVLPGSSG